MDRFIRIAAYIANIILIVAAALIAKSAYGEEVFAATLLAVPPILSLFALYNGPDWEERQLAKRLNKMRMRKELADLEK